LLRIEDGKVIPTKEVISAADGVDQVLQSLRGRRLVLITFSAPRKAVVIDFDQPHNDGGYVFRESSDERMLFASCLVQDPVLGLRFVGLRGTAKGPFSIEAVRIQLDIDRPALINENTPGTDDLKFAEFTGTSGVANLGFHDVGITRVDPSTNALAMYRGTGHFTFPLPPALYTAADAGSGIAIHIKNNELLVLTESRSFDDSLAGKKATSLWYQHRPSGTWRNLATVGKPEIRGFGHWFAFTERKVDLVLAARAQKQRNVTAKEFRDIVASRPKPSQHPVYRRATGPDIQLVFQNHEFDGMPWNYTGVFRIVDSANPDLEWNLDTGNENSEILLIEAPRILYRVEDALWQATLDPTGKIIGQTKLAQNPRLLDAHWAFYSNSKMPGVELSMEPAPFPSNSRRHTKKQ
jgi:hypothetical protein